MPAYKSRDVGFDRSMIGGYGHLSYAFNYYGTIAPNRDDFAWVRKMNKVDWMDEEADKKGGAV